MGTRTSQSWLTCTASSWDGSKETHRDKNPHTRFRACAGVLATGIAVGAGVGRMVGVGLREPPAGVFRLSSGTNVGLGVLVTWGVGLGVDVRLLGLARASEPSPPIAPQLTVKNRAMIAKTANLDTS